jgi:hypothetical protein
MIALTLFIIYVIGAVVTALFTFQCLFPLTSAIAFTVGWPIIILYIIGNRVFA